MLNVCDAGNIASAGATASNRYPAYRLDENVENETRDSTLSLRPLMHVAV